MRMQAGAAQRHSRLGMDAIQRCGRCTNSCGLVSQVLRMSGTHGAHLTVKTKLWQAVVIESRAWECSTVPGTHLDGCEHERGAVVVVRRVWVEALLQHLRRGGPQGQ